MCLLSLQVSSRGYAAAAAAPVKVRLALHPSILASCTPYIPVVLSVFMCTSKLVCCLVQAPIRVFGVEGRYAHALFSAASQKNAIESVEKELTDFQVLPVPHSY